MNKRICTPEELTNEDYHKDTAIGSSGIKEFAECPALYEYEYLDPFKAKERANKYKSIGSHAHVALLEPELFASKFKVSPEFAVTYKGQKNEDIKHMNEAHADYKAFANEALEEGKTPLLFSKYKQCLAMTAAIKRHELASAMLTGDGKNEMSFFAKDPVTGLILKSRPDRLVNVPGMGVVLVDYKTTAISLGTTKQSNHAFGLEREIQAAHHKNVTELATVGVINEVVYITQMQEAPHLIRIFRMTPEDIALGAEKCRMYLDAIADCWEKGVFPGYPETIEDLIRPKWVDNQYN